ncbi:terpene cyclase/mutase family protein, partial [Pirellulales bacterium]|nr:terpene cyclase/mutase family protein [Pirellulales bacterium]
MSRGAYLAELLVQLAEGLGRLTEERRRRHAKWLGLQQQPDGGFPGREAGSDLYYSAFALRALAILGTLDGELAERAAEYLRSKLQRNVSVIDLISLVLAARQIEFATGADALREAEGAWLSRLVEKLEQLRTDDGGYGKTSEGSAGSTYQTFLTALVYQVLEIPQPEADRAVQFLLDQRRDDGGFVEIRVMHRSGVNPTAAAVGALDMLGVELQRPEETIDFLAELQNDEGGFRANTRIPIADLLSTFTALQTLSDLRANDAADALAARRFAAALEQPAGGFHAAAWDDTADVEYT